MNKLPMLSPWLQWYFTEHISTERNLALNTGKSYRDTFVMLYLTLPPVPEYRWNGCQSAISQQGMCWGFLITSKPSVAVPRKLATSA